MAIHVRETEDDPWVPKALISDHGTHLCNSLLEKMLKEYGVTYRFAAPYHPQTSGQTKNTNRAIKHILERTNVYGKLCHLPIKMEQKAYWALKKVNFDLNAAGKTGSLNKEDESKASSARKNMPARVKERAITCVFSMDLDKHVWKKTSIEQETREMDKIIKQWMDSQDLLPRNHPAGVTP
ncbi:reverse transcriptase domain-containing protein [Tanacetum coccineum]